MYIEMIKLRRWFCIINTSKMNLNTKYYLYYVKYNTQIVKTLGF